MRRIKWSIFTGVFLIIAFIIILLFPRQPQGPYDPEQKIIKVGSTEAFVFIADTYEEQAQGLQKVIKLAENEGMLFEFQDRSIKTFWNLETSIDLDVIWISNDTVIGITPLPNKQDNGQITVSSLVPADKVLEMPMGWAAAHGVAVGTKVELDN